MVDISLDTAILQVGQYAEQTDEYTQEAWQVIKRAAKAVPTATNSARDAIALLLAEIVEWKQERSNSAWMVDMIERRLMGIAQRHQLRGR